MCGLWTHDHGEHMDLAEHKKSFCLQLHATLADARLVRSLFDLFYHHDYQRRVLKHIFFNTHITSSSAYGGGLGAVFNLKQP